MENCIEKGENLVARRLIEFSYYDNYTFKSETSNISHVIDAMLRVTTKITEHYAGDICYEIESLKNAMEAQAPYAKLLAFCEDGVASYPVEFHEVVDAHTPLQPFVVLHEQYRRAKPESIQVWLLRHIPANGTTDNAQCVTIFKRMSFAL